MNGTFSIPGLIVYHVYYYKAIIIRIFISANILTNIDSTFLQEKTRNGAWNTEQANWRGCRGVHSSSGVY